MLRNTAKQRLSDGQVICGYGITMPAAGLAQALCASQADFITIDLEHGCIDLADTHALIAAMGPYACTPLVRVPSVHSSFLKPVLDSGALGIVFPMIRTGEELSHGIQSMLYPPRGTRGIGHHFAPARWQMSPSSYLEQANDAMLTVALIETAEAVRNIDEIIHVPGLDLATIAPGDLAASLGHPGDFEHAEVKDAVGRVEAAVKKSGVALGGVAMSVDDAKRKLARNYRALVLGFDIGILQRASAELVAAIRN